MPHAQYHISGRLAVRMGDGSKVEFGPGDVWHIPPSHDAWVVGDQAIVAVDVTRMSEYAKPK